MLGKREKLPNEGMVCFLGMGILASVAWSLVCEGARREGSLKGRFGAER